jgi:osmotically inducible protein OsmC
MADYDGPLARGKRPYFQSITCYQQDIGRATSVRVNVCRSFMNRNASAVWKGTLRGGAGKLTTESGVLLKTQYSYLTSFSEGIGTNPDELIAASLSGCFAMALSNELGLCGFHPESIETTATATLEDLAAGWTLTHMQLDVRANVPDASPARFMAAALAAKTKSPIARLLNTTISMAARLDP